MKKICHITTVHDAYDDRIFHKECLSLAQAGFYVTLIAKYKCDDLVNGVKIYSLPNKNSRLYRILLQFIVIVKALKVNAKIYHFHDPELMFVGVLLRLTGKKVVYDVHEDIVKQVLYKKWIKYSFIRSLLSKIIDFSEKFCTLFFNKIIAVTDDIAIKFNSRKILLIHNYPIISLIDKCQPISVKDTESIKLIYAGGLTEVRGIKEIINALDYIESKTELYLLGAWDNDEYRAECMNLKSWKKVNYIGTLSLGEVYPYVKSSDIGLCLLYPAKNYLTSLPVKAFEYMACEKPMVMSDFEYWKEIFNDVAVFCNPLISKEIATCIQKLIDNKIKAETMGKKARKLILEKFSWEVEKLKLIDMYHQLLSK